MRLTKMNPRAPSFYPATMRSTKNEEGLPQSPRVDAFPSAETLDVDDDLHIADDSAQDVAGRMYDDSLLNPPEDTWAGTRILPDGLEENELEVHDENFYFLDADMPEQTEYSES